MQIHCRSWWCRASALFWGILWLATGFAAHAQAQATNHGSDATGTIQMAQRLQNWAQQLGRRNPYANAAALEFLKARIRQTVDPMERFQLQYDLATELLQDGHVEPCLNLLSNLLSRSSPDHMPTGAGNRRQVKLLQGLAFMRLGEVENCLEHHNPESCLIPIQPPGQHTQSRGSLAAEQIFAELARQKTNDLGARWLLNVAAMTLGKYPDGVPPNLLIPPSVFASEHPLQKFPEIAGSIGLAVDDIAGGTIVEDFDRDGLLDVLFTSWATLNQCHYFKNLGNGRFEERTQQAGLSGVTGGLNAIQTDYNNDGWPDIYIVRGAWLGELGRLPDSLLRNNGDGTFSDVTEEVGLLAFEPALAAVWFDANNDGWLDLFVGNETDDPLHPHPCQLFLNDGHGHFHDVAASAGVALTRFVRGVTAGDYDNDGWPDLYISCLRGGNILLHNDGHAPSANGAAVHFTDVSAAARVSEPMHSFPSWFFDFNNDGWLDIFSCGYGMDGNAYSPDVGAGHATLNEYVADRLGLPSKGAKPKLYRNNHRGAFSDVTEQAGLNHVFLAMGANFGDLDNDGWLDFYLGTGTPYFGSLVPNEMLRNDGGQRFQNVTSAGGFGHLQKGHAIAFADLNNDGQQEVVLNVGGAFPGDNYFDAVFANPDSTNHWLCLKLMGIRSNRAAIGARIKVVTSEAGVRREIYRVVSSGASFGASPLRQEIGLGSASRIERVEVGWPASGQTNIVTGLDLDQFYEVTEGQTQARPLTPKRFSWPELLSSETHHHAH